MSCRDRVGDRIDQERHVVVDDRYAHPPPADAAASGLDADRRFTFPALSSDFRQEKELAALAEKMTSTGKFWFKRSDRVRIDYEKPFIYRLIINGDKILLKDEQKENRVNVKSNKLFQQVNKIMLDCIQGTILDSKDFTTSVSESDKQYLLQMTPVNKTIRDFFSTINLYVDKADYSASRIIMVEPGGDETLLIFTNKQLNKPMNDEVFAF